MKQNLYGGKFIVFEGLDGSGQSTQAALLKEYLERQGKEVLLTKEPTSKYNAGKLIREILQGRNKSFENNPIGFQELYAEDRAQHLHGDIFPALLKGMIVISDRYYLSTLAFGASEGASTRILKKMNDGFLYPDLTLYIKVSPEVCIPRIMARAEKEGKVVEHFETLAKLKKVFPHYNRLCQPTPSRPNIHIISGEKSVEEVHREIVRILEKKK